MVLTLSHCDDSPGTKPLGCGKIFVSKKKLPKIKEIKETLLSS
jgi:hypothetical protein